MKKIVLISLILILGLLLAACGGSEGAPEGEPSENSPRESGAAAGVETAAGGDVEVVVSPPDGWEPVESLGFLAHYSKDGASFMFKEEPYSGKTLDEVVLEAKEIFEGTFDNVRYVGEVEDLKVDGIDAKKFVFSCDVSGTQMQYQYVFLFIDSEVYVITFGHAAGKYDAFAAEFDQILNSLHFQ